MYLDIAATVALRGSCERLSVGAVLVKDKHIVSSGYNGSPSGMPHCLDVGCYEVDGHCIRTVHAETNAIAHAARHGIATEGATIYVTHFPCWNCAKILMAAGVKKLVYRYEYNGELVARTESVLRQVGVVVLDEREAQQEEEEVEA